LRIITALVFALTLLAPASFAWELRERPAEPGEWGYRPADGSTPDLNPPAFSWSPELRADTYEVHVIRPGAPEQAVTEISTEWSAATSPSVLEPGEYAWRYRAFNKSGEASAWSRERKFTVAAEAAAFPRPTLDKLRTRIPDEHPRLFVRPEQRDELRSLTENGRLAEAWDAIVGDAEQLLTREYDTSEPPLYPDGIEWKGETWKEIWWGNRKRAIAVVEPAARMAFVYWMTGDERFGERARELMMAVMQWDPSGSTQWKYNDEAAMPLLYWPSRIYTWAYDRFTEAEREKILEVMQVRARDCFNHLRGGRHLWRPYSSHSNRAWHWLMEAGIAFHDVIPDAPRWLDYSTTIFYSAYPVWGGADGAWHEGVSYWRSYIYRFQYGAMAMREALGINAFDKPFFSANGYFGLYTLPPGAEAGGWGDLSADRRSGQIAELMGILASGAGNSHWQWYADRHDVNIASDSWFGFLLAARSSGVESKPPTDLPSSRAFKDTGLAVLNSNLLDGKDNVQVHFKSSPWGRQSHGYNANNAFLLNIDGQRALIRSGRRDVHGSPHHVKWMWSTRSDNAILVNGEGQFPHTPEAQGRITHFETSEILDIVTGEAGDSYDNLDRWTRTLYFLKPDVLFIHDVLEAPEPSTYQWLLHAQAPFELEEQAARVDTKGGSVRVRFLHPAGIDLSQNNEFDPPPHEWATFTLDEWHLTAATRQPAARQEFVALITVKGAEPEFDLDLEARSIACRHDGKTFSLTLGE